MQLKQVRKEFTLSHSFSSQKGRLLAVDNVSLELLPKQTLGLVGESGCGKTTLAKILCGLEKPTSGEILFKEHPLHLLPDESIRKLRQGFQPIFQDPFGSLNPRFTVLETLTEPLIIFGLPSSTSTVLNLLATVGLGEELLNRYPHQLSGGQRQRLGIARALAVQPELLIADEPLSSLDVSIQAQVLNLLLDLKEKLNLSILFISHDLRVVSHISDFIAIMYLGRIMESGPTRTLFQNPRHPYTQALFKALPKLAPGRNRTRAFLQGELPSPINPNPGCRFFSRCRYAQAICQRYENTPETVTSTHVVACCRWQTTESHDFTITS
jgi:oligopeptide/dipeptide ABC transporter ATP-binding protein